MEREEALLTSIAVLTFTASRGSVHQVNLLGQFREMATPSTAESRVSCEMRSDQGARLIRPSSATYIGAGKEDSCNYKHRLYERLKSILETDYCCCCCSLML